MQKHNSKRRALSEVKKYTPHLSPQEPRWLSKFMATRSARVSTLRTKEAANLHVHD